MFMMLSNSSVLHSTLPLYEIGTGIESKRICSLKSRFAVLCGGVEYILHIVSYGF